MAKEETGKDPKNPLQNKGVGHLNNNVVETQTSKKQTTK